MKTIKIIFCLWFRRRQVFVIFIFCLFFAYLPARSGYGEEAEVSKYPMRPITYIIPQSPGSSVDLAVRLLAKEMEKYFGQPFVIVNKPGGGGSIGLSVVAHAKPDGYTIGLCPGGGALFIMPFLEKLPYRPLQDFRYVVQLVDFPFAVAVKGDSPFKSFNNLIHYARQNPGTVTYGTNAPNSISNLIMDQVAKKENVKLTHIPFKSSPEYLTAVMGGHVTFSAGGFSQSLVDDKEIKLLAFLSEKTPTQGVPVPTLKDLGYDALLPSAMIGVLGPNGLPDSIVRKLEGAFSRALKEPAVVKGLKDLELPVLFRNSVELTQYVNRNYDAFGQLLKELGLAKQ